jgi:hypothetical protein
MLFALAIAQIAINAAAIFAVSAALVIKIAAAAHLSVALLLIACSWVGWRLSRSPGVTEPVTGVYRKSFLDLLLDVLLVIVYFIIVQRAEINTVAGQIVVELTSASPEAIGVLSVFVIYVLWDLLTDVLSAKYIPEGIRFFSLKTFSAAFVSTFASILCLVLTAGVLLAAKDTNSTAKVVALDFALGAIILLFRSVKALETPLSRKLDLTRWPAFSEPREAGKPQKVGGWICVVVYIIAVTCVWAL